jgi:DNA-directed RNA polymerase specialized sigma24 family protein
MRALERLTAGQREILALDLVHLMTHREMSEALGRSVDAVRKAHLRALQALRAALEQSDAGARPPPPGPAGPT